MLDNIDLGIILNREHDAQGNEYMVFKNIKERVKTYRSYICQPFHKDNGIKLIEDFYSPMPVFKESLYDESMNQLNTQHHNNNVKKNGYNSNIITIDDDEENLFEYSKVYSSDDVKEQKESIEIRVEETTAIPNLANFVNPYGFNINTAPGIPVVHEEPLLNRGVYYDIA
jgi:hypothetical protein